MRWFLDDVMLLVSGLCWWMIHPCGKPSFSDAYLTHHIHIIHDGSILPYISRVCAIITVHLSKCNNSIISYVIRITYTLRDVSTRKMPCCLLRPEHPSVTTNIAGNIFTVSKFPSVVFSHLNCHYGDRRDYIEDRLCSKIGSGVMRWVFRWRNVADTWM